ncbi:MAG: hypothetical protein GY928_17640 [Colwellia sp.]|nr:hypothetical protein [Colwellia sp.]
MEIELQGNEIKLSPTSYNMIPDEWLWDSGLSLADTTRLARLYWRYDFFRSVAKDQKKRVMATNYMYLTQDAYSELLELSRTKIPAFFKRLEEAGYIVRVKAGKQVYTDNGLEMVPRDYLVVLNKSHKDYEQDLQDVKVALSQRLTSLESKGKQNQTTYKQMKTSYDRLFEGQERYVPPEKANLDLEPDVDLISPVFEEVPLDCYEDYGQVQEVVEEDGSFNDEWEEDEDWVPF